ncbi:carbohydrate kinase family protein [Streptomyces cellulosae]|uniref:hypothetical protein n=1 Tax=Streptomyces cellulosae TaxID=1968 RepID=UPI001900DD02|nr:hypothetical protein [Streptomyces cellulosae]
MSARPEPADQPAVVAGDALVNLTPARTADGAAAFQPRPGGSCLNAPPVPADSESPRHCSRASPTTHFGDLLRAHLTASGTRLIHALPASDPTTLAAARLREDGSAAHSFHANGTADRGLRPEHLAALPDGGTLPAGTALHLGSLGLLLEPLASTLDGLIRREAGRRLVSLDPNVRPGPGHRPRRLSPAVHRAGGARSDRGHVSVGSGCWTTWGRRARRTWPGSTPVSRMRGWPNAGSRPGRDSS